MKRLIGLDAIRGIAALSVVLYHYTTRFNELFEIDVITDVFDFPLGHYGVHLFFILSGFVIFMSVRNVSGISEFLYKRFIRLFPTFWISLTTTFLIIIAIGPLILHRTFWDFIVNFTMIPSLLGVKPIDGVYWSLVPELIFYFWISIAIVFKQIEKIEYYAFAILFIIIVNDFIALRYVYKLFNLEYGVYFISGISLYNITYKRNVFVNYFLLSFSLVTIFVINYGNYLDIFMNLLVYVIFILFINIKTKNLIIEFLVFFGIISYPLYLVHQYIGYSLMLLLLPLFEHHPIIIVSVTIIMSIFIASIITFLFEEPILKYLKSNYKRLNIILEI